MEHFEGLSLLQESFEVEFLKRRMSVFSQT